MFVPVAAAGDDDPIGTLFDALPIGAYRTRPDGSLLRANPALAHLNGFDNLDALFAAVHDIGREWYVDPARRAEFAALLMRDGQVSGFVSQVRRYADQQPIWVSENAHVARRADGSVAYYEGTVEDITERVQAQSRQARDEMYLREIAEHIPGMAYRVHFPRDQARPAHYSFVSAGVRQLYGLGPDELMRDARALRRFRHPEDSDRVDAEVAAAVRAGLPLTVAFRIIVDGQVKWVQMSSSAVDSGGDGQIRVGVMLDVTTQHQSEQLLAERDRADHQRGQMTQFLSRVSHELRTPLNAILGLAQLIEMESDTPALQRRWAQTLLESGRHLLDLVNDVLDLTGAQSGQMMVDSAEVDVAGALREAWRMVAAGAAEQGLHFGGIPVEPGQLTVQADRRRLLQVLVNLLSNAVKYNRPGGHVAVAVTQRSAHELVVAVSDSGPGLTPLQLEHLFEPFNRLGRENGGIEGTGIGLALSRLIAQQMGGRIEVQTQPDGGSTFSLVLPVAGTLG